jgi:hypothetical protein
MDSTRVTGALALTLTWWAARAEAQFDVRWAEFRNDTATHLVADPAVGAADPEEKDFAWGDVDKDGDIDLVVVRKQPGTTAGRKPNLLFLNEGGRLVDRTSEYASASDVPGDKGFLTPTNDRDVVLADFDGDSWLDIATAVTISDGLAKDVSHPRIYRNLGAPEGVWKGFRFEADRSPQLYVLKPDGTPDFRKPSPGRFCAIAAGDADMDGDVDLFLGDYDSSGGGGLAEPPGVDLNDRLWLNDGAGHFTDSYQTRMTAEMLNSAFNVSAQFADVNGDGRPELIKDTALNSPLIYVGIAYDLVGNDGVFDSFHKAHLFAPYFVSLGDLNHDDRLDMVLTDDTTDRYRMNLGNDALGRATWGPALTVRYPDGALYGDDGFGGQSTIADLDRDGWDDVLITDADVDGFTCNRRTHIYRNLGDPPDNTLREEAELPTAGNGWKGAVGLNYADLSGTYNVAAFDRDNDGDQDLVLGRCAGTSVWTNQLCRLDRYGSPRPNSTHAPARLAWQGNASYSENGLELRATGLPPGAAGAFVLAWRGVNPCVPDGDGLRCVDATARRHEIPAVAGRDGVARANVDFTALPGMGPGGVRYVQFRYADPAGGRAGYNWSDALDLKACP